MFYDIFINLCKEKGIKPSRAANDCGINRSNVSNWKNNGYTPRGEALNAIAKYFNVSVDYLLETEQKKEPLSNREEQGKDLSKQLDEILLELELQADGLMFSGQALDDRTKEALIISLRNAMELAEAMNKKETDSD